MSRDPVKRCFADFNSEALYHEEGAILEFTEQVVDAMQAQGLKRSELAARLGTSKPYITQILQGSTNFSFRTAVRLALAVGKKFRTILEEDRELRFHMDLTSPDSVAKAAAEGEAAVSSVRHGWAFVRAASFIVASDSLGSA